ncbi:hypothetical protein P3W45_000202 [Vairimorpha bombi]|jgi:hypothetical protein
MNSFVYWNILYGWFTPLNKIPEDPSVIDPYLNQTSDSKDQESPSYAPSKEKASISDSSSTNKELFDDIGGNKIRENKVISKPQAEDAALTAQKLDEFHKTFSEALELGDTVSSITDKDMWKRLYEYISINLPKFFIDGHFSIAFEIRYVMCSYVVAYIPGQFAFVIPGFYTYLIPKKAYTVPVLADGLKGLKKFFKFCKRRSRDSLMITFFIGRENSVLEDLKFILDIPHMITVNPLGILRELLGFRIKAEGYDPDLEKL